MCWCNMSLRAVGLGRERAEGMMEGTQAGLSVQDAPTADGQGERAQSPGSAENESE